jgi:hypothetical protein
MDIALRTTAAAIALSLLTLPGAAQVGKVSPEDVVDGALDMKRASEKADKLIPDGTKYCKWGVASLDTSDLEVAISRSLLNHGSNVPEKIPASKMWRVSLVAADIINQFAMNVSECDLRLRSSDQARAVFLSASPALERLITVRTRFDELAYQQTRWQEQSTQAPRNDEVPDPPGAGKLATGEILAAAREMKEAAEAAGRVTATSRKNSACIHADNQGKAPDFTDLTKLIDYMIAVSGSNSTSTIPAANMWGVSSAGDAAQVDILLTLEGCSTYAGEKKEARSAATESLQVYHRLTAAIAAFDALALRQTEWEEKCAALSESVIREQ